MRAVDEIGQDVMLTATACVVALDRNNADELERYARRLREHGEVLLHASEVMRQKRDAAAERAPYGRRGDVGAER